MTGVKYTIRIDGQDTRWGSSYMSNFTLIDLLITCDMTPITPKVSSLTYTYDVGATAININPASLFTSSN